MLESSYKLTEGPTLIIPGRGKGLNKQSGRSKLRSVRRNKTFPKLLQRPPLPSPWLLAVIARVIAATRPTFFSNGSESPRMQQVPLFSTTIPRPKMRCTTNRRMKDTTTSRLTSLRTTTKDGVILRSGMILRKRKQTLVRGVFLRVMTE